VIVEGGGRLLQSFIDEGMWDEARVIGNRQLAIGNGLTSPQLTNCEKTSEENVSSDTIHFYKSA
jgi:diaminohydroxyphosphoribosylaminopyrimidine deaminase / 5-amino-6-(5-phosphoribosylamino)uracil reductase